MSRIELVNPESTKGETKEIFGQINKAFGTTPNMFKAIGNSPAALQMMWSAFGALGKGKIDAKLGEQIAVAVANENHCQYCLSAHTVLGKNAGVSTETLAQAQVGKSTDPKTQAALDFALKLVRQKGKVTEDDVKTLRKAGYYDEEVTEILAHTVLNIFTNYTNIAFDIPVDFPKVDFAH